MHKAVVASKREESLGVILSLEAVYSGHVWRTRRESERAGNLKLFHCKAQEENKAEILQ
jgi:hypothetical protein